MFLDPSNTARTIASIWVTSRYGFLPQIISCEPMDIDRESSLQGITNHQYSNVYSVFFRCDYETDSKGFPPYLCVFVDARAEKVVGFEPEGKEK